MTDDVAQVWAAYAEHHPRAVLDDQRQRLIERRLKVFPAETLVEAIEGNHRDEFCNGGNSRQTRYHGLGLILRDADHIERYAAIRANGAAPNRPPLVSELIEQGLL